MQRGNWNGEDTLSSEGPNQDDPHTVASAQEQPREDTLEYARANRARARGSTSEATLSDLEVGGYTMVERVSKCDELK